MKNKRKLRWMTQGWTVQDRACFQRAGPGLRQKIVEGMECDHKYRFSTRLVGHRGKFVEMVHAIEVKVDGYYFVEWDEELRGWIEYQIRWYYYLES